MKKKVFLLLPLIASLSGCTIFDIESSNLGSSSINENSSSLSSGNGNNNNNNNNNKNEPLNDEGLAPAIKETDPEAILLYDDFYNPSSDVKMTIRIHNEHFQQVMDNGSPYNETAHDIYSPCDVAVNVNGEVREFPEVGIRLKGNTSRMESSWSYYGGHFDGHAHFKLAFNETFEDNTSYTPKTATKTLKKRRFGKAKKINIKWNRNRDEDFVKESYASHILEEEGLMAQKCNNIKVTFITDDESQEYIYSVQENIDSEFLEKRLSEECSQGDLYKGGWVGSDSLNMLKDDDYLFGVEDCTQNKFYVYDLKTNKKSSDFSIMKNLITALKSNDSGKTQTELKNKLNQFVSVDYLLRFMALEWVIGNPDSLRYHYNNTYFYFSSKNNLMYPIMYDNDRCFGIREGWEITPNRYPSTTKTTMDMEMSTTQDNPLYWRTILKQSPAYPYVEEYRNKYLDYVEEYASKYLNVEYYNAYKNSFHYLDNTSGNNMSFNDYASSMLTQMEYCFRSEGRIS